MSRELIHVLLCWAVGLPMLIVGLVAIYRQYKRDVSRRGSE